MIIIFTESPLLPFNLLSLLLSESLSLVLLKLLLLTACKILESVGLFKLSLLVIFYLFQTFFALFRARHL